MSRKTREAVSRKAPSEPKRAVAAARARGRGSAPAGRSFPRSVRERSGLVSSDRSNSGLKVEGPIQGLGFRASVKFGM